MDHIIYINMRPDEHNEYDGPSVGSEFLQNILNNGSKVAKSSGAKVAQKQQKIAEKAFDNKKKMEIK